MPVAADLSRCIPFTSAFCHRMALYKQVALFNLSGLTSSRYRLSLPGNCDDAIKREISFLSENIVSIVVLLLHLILFTIRRLHRITLASLFLIRTDCLFDALVSPFGMVSPHGEWFYSWLYLALNFVPCLGFIIQLSKKQEITDIILISLLLGGCDIHLIACISLLFSSFFSSSQLSGQNNAFSAN